jgi:hypothetical protein
MRHFLKIFNNLPVAWIVAVLAFVCFGFASVWFGGLNQDEGWYLYAAQSVYEGKMPYRDFFYTQGPIMPYVYSRFVPVWQSLSSPLHGLLGGRIITLMFGLFTTLFAVSLARGLSSMRGKAIAGFSLFVFFACNLYHLYFNTIPKTYALGSMFLIAGFLLLFNALKAGAFLRVILLFVSGISISLASGTRISLILIPAVVCITLLLSIRRYKLSFLWFGVGVFLGLSMTYGILTLNEDSRAGLLAAQWYHASRGGFDFFFALGSVSRLLRGYASAAIIGFLVFAFSLVKANKNDLPSFPENASFIIKTMLASFIAVFLLQLSAPFPYDDYQVPIMGLVVIPIAVLFARYFPSAQFGWFALAVSLLVSGTSPLLQEWTTYSPDRFWARKVETSELGKLRKVAKKINELDPGGKMLLTQDLYLAIETSRKVPAGFEMGPFSFFPKFTQEEASRMHVHNIATLKDTIKNSSCPIAAMSGYGFAIAAPECGKTEVKDLNEIGLQLDESYEIVESVSEFGQNETTLTIYKRKGETK